MADNFEITAQQAITAPAKIGTPSLLTPNSGSNSSSSNKPDIKISSDGVAKLNFSFLDDMHGSDNSLEPGEVVTPPNSSPVPSVAILTTAAAVARAAAAAADDADPKTQVQRTISQTEAQVCEEKVRAILELDAIKRKEELEKRKLELEKRRQSGELEREEEAKRKAKEERKRIKKIEKEQRAARLALLSDENDETHATDGAEISTKKKSKRHSEDRESYESGERASSSDDDGGEDNSAVKSEREPSRRTGVTSVAVHAGPGPIYHPPLPAPHLPPYPEAYVGSGFRPPGAFNRGIRGEFFHGRGGYPPRGRGMRGGINNAVRYAMYRTPYYGGNAGGAMPPRSHGQLSGQRAPPPMRGHSPIQSPAADLNWTKTLPSISYTYRKPLDEKSMHKSSETAEKSTSKSGKHSKKSSKKLKKEKKSKSQEKDKHSSRVDSCHKSSLRKIAKIRKSLEVGRKHESGLDLESVDSKAVETTATTIEPDAIKQESTIKQETKFVATESVALKLETNAEAHKLSCFTETNIPDKQEFDMFAVSPLRKADADEKADNSRRSGTPPIELLLSSVKEGRGQVNLTEKTPLQKAIEMQQRIGKLLQEDDDLKPEMLEATKERLRQKANQLSNVTPTKATSTTALENSQNTKDPQPKQPSESNTPERQAEQTAATSTSSPKYVNPFKRSVSQSSIVNHSNDSSVPPVADIERKRSKSREQSRGRRRSRSQERPKPPVSSQIRTRHESAANDSAGKRKRSSTPAPAAACGSGSGSERGHRSYSRGRKFSKTEELATRPHSRNETTIEKHESERTKKHKDDKPKKSKKAKLNTPLSFNASEFLFPEDDDEANSDIDPSLKHKAKTSSVKSKLPSSKKASTTSSNSQRDANKRASWSQQQSKSSSTFNKRSNSPDSDDYMDNWELDDPDSPNAAVESPTKAEKYNDKLRDSSKTASEEIYTVALPPHMVAAAAPLKPTAAADLDDDEAAGGTPPNTPPRPPPKTSLKTEPVPDAETSASTSSGGVVKELFAMQDIYDEFIKSVEANGITITPTKTNQSEAIKKQTQEEEALTPTKRADKRNLSTSSNSSTSSTSSNSSSTSSGSSESSNSSSSSHSSTSSTSTSATDDSKDADMDTTEISAATVDDATIPATNKDRKSHRSSNSPDAISIEEKSQLLPCASTPPPLAAKANAAQTLEVSPTANWTADGNHAAQSPPQFASFQDPVEAFMELLPATPTEAQQAQITKDLKRIKSYDANLKRTQMMRANFDSSDDIFGELAKMEKLFLHAINFILKKYTKEHQKPLPVYFGSRPEDGGHPMPVDLHSNSEDLGSRQQEILPAENTIPPSDVNNIFDSNREAIKLTIAPIKFTKSPAIFDKLEKPESETCRLRGSSVETDFTETLVKPTKEIAVVKPMMDEGSPRERRSSSRRTNSSARPHTPCSSSSGSRGGEFRSRRSTSRSRHGSGQKQGRTTARSVSPARRGAHIRHESPKRRGRNASPPPRYRSDDRRSRSPLRRSASKRAPSPFNRRRRPNAPNANSGARGARPYDACPSYSRSRSNSASRSPGRHHYRVSGRPHSPRSPLSKIHRRSYSRDRYSRSPLPFKPPSPPMRHSPEPPGEGRRSLSSLSGRFRHSRSRSGSQSPFHKIPRSPRSPRSRSPRSPRSPHSPRPRSPPPLRYERHHEREGSYDMYRSHSPQQQHSYYSTMGEMDSAMGMHASSASSEYYYGMSPSHMGMDARLNVAHNGPEGDQSNASGCISTPYHGYSAHYGQYTGGVSAYLQPGIHSPHAGPNTGGNPAYYGNQFMPPPATASNGAPTNQMAPPMYSNIMTTPNLSHQQQQHLHPASRSDNYYFNSQTQPQQPQQHQQRPQAYSANASFLKELPKATVAVQKGNVLEIVLSELSHSPAAAPCRNASAIHKSEPPPKLASVKQTKPPKPVDPVKEEINSRLLKSAQLKIVKKSESTPKGSILKAPPAQPTQEAMGTPIASVATPAVKKEPTESILPAKKRKKVLFEDGLFPDHDSDDEDAKFVEQKLLGQLKRLRKKSRKAAIVFDLLISRQPGAKQRPTIAELAKLPPPPTPSYPPALYLKQPVLNRPPTPPRYTYYHYDPVVQAFYMSNSEEAVPPRLTDPKAAAAFAAANAKRARSSPMFTTKRDHVGNPVAALKLAATSHSNRGSASPQPSQVPFYGPRRINISFPKTLPSTHQQHPASHAYNPLHQQRHHHGEALISTLSTQPLLQPNPLSKPTAAATFHTINPNSPQMPVSPAPGQVPQPRQLQPQLQMSMPMPTTMPPVAPPPPMGFVNAMQPQRPAYPFPVAGGAGGGFIHPRNMQPQRPIYHNMSQPPPVAANGFPNPTASPQMRQPTTAETKSYAYYPYVPQAAARPPMSLPKKPLLGQPPTRPVQNFPTQP